MRFLYKDYPCADQGPGVTAALAARCAGETRGRTGPCMTACLPPTDDWTWIVTPACKAIGLDQAQFRQCLRDAPHMKAIFKTGTKPTPGEVSWYARFYFDADDAAADGQNPGACHSGAFPFGSVRGGIEKLLASQERSQ